MGAELPADGRITTCEISTRNAAVAAVHFAASPYAERIHLRVGAAQPVIGELPGPFDLVFIHADNPPIWRISRPCWPGRPRTG